MGFVSAKYNVNVPKMSNSISNTNIDVNFKKVNFDNVEVLEDFSDEKITVPLEVYDTNNKEENINNQNNKIVNAVVPPLSYYDSTSAKYNSTKNEYFQKYKELINKEELDHKRTGASIGVFTFSCVEGLLFVGEGLFDLLVIGATVVVSPKYLLKDWFFKLFGLDSHETENLWALSRAIVSPNLTSKLGDYFFDKTWFGKYLSDNAYDYELFRSLGNTFGYVGGVIGLSMLTGGLAGVGAEAGAGGGALLSASEVPTGLLAANAAAVGMGENTQNAWAAGASTGEGLFAGMIGAGIDAAQWGLGSYISKGKFFSKTGSLVDDTIGQRIGNISTKTLLAGGLGATEIPAMAGVDSLYKGDYQANFKNRGGWANMVGDAAIAGAFMATAQGVKYNQTNSLSKKISIQDELVDVYDNITKTNSSVEYNKMNNYYKNYLSDYFAEVRKTSRSKTADDLREELETDIDKYR